MARILVVDDNSVVQRTLTHILRKKDHTVTVASNGNEALDYLNETPFDLGIFDIAMPEMDGLTLLGRVRQDPRFRLMPVIMLTASGQDEDRINARGAGANDFLNKPTSSRELLETVQRWVQPSGPVK